SRYRFLADSPPAKRTGTVSRIYQALVRQPQQLRVQRIEEHTAQLRGRPAERHAEVGPTHVADKQCVPREHGMRVDIAGVEVVNENGDRLRSVAWRFQHLEAYAPEFDHVAIATGSKCVPRFGRSAEINRCAHATAQFQMPSNEIGVEMSQEYVLDLKRMLG